MKNLLMLSSIILGGIGAALLLTGCQTIQPYNGKTGYQREPSSPQQTIISYTLDSKTSEALVQQKLQKACARVLNQPENTAIRIQIMDQKEFVNVSTMNVQTENHLALGNVEGTSFGLSNTPKLSNTDNLATNQRLHEAPDSLKTITAECLQR